MLEVKIIIYLYHQRIAEKKSLGDIYFIDRLLNQKTVRDCLKSEEILSLKIEKKINY